MDRIDKPFVFEHGVCSGFRFVDTSGEEDVLAEVNRFALRPLEGDEIAVFRFDLCNNQIDDRFSRFPDEELDDIAGLAVGRPLMERHQMRSSLPRGTMFRSHVHREGELATVRCDAYMLRTEQNRDFIANIEGGVYRETSIGFGFRKPECSVCGEDLRGCRHLPGREYQGERCHYVMRGVKLVKEVSVVAMGGQGTKFLAQVRSAEDALEAWRSGEMGSDAGDPQCGDPAADREVADDEAMAEGPVSGGGVEMVRLRRRRLELKCKGG